MQKKELENLEGDKIMKKDYSNKEKILIINGLLEFKEMILLLDKFIIYIIKRYNLEKRQKLINTKIVCFA